MLVETKQTTGTEEFYVQGECTDSDIKFKCFRSVFDLNSQDWNSVSKDASIYFSLTSKFHIMEDTERLTAEYGTIKESLDKTQLEQQETDDKLSEI